MSIEVQDLQIEIQSNAQSAVSGVDALAASLAKLKLATKGGAGLSAVAKNLETVGQASGNLNSSSVKNLSGLVSALQRMESLGSLKISSSIASQISNIGMATKVLDGVNLSPLSGLASSLAPLTTLGKTNLSTTFNQLSKLPALANELSSVNMGGFESSIRALSSSLTPLAEMGRSNMGSTLTQLKKLPEVASSLVSLDLAPFSSKVKELTITLAPLGTQMDKISKGFAAFPAKLQKIISSNSTLTSSNKKLTESYGALGTGIDSSTFRFSALLMIIKQVGNKIGQWLKSSNDYVEDLNLFTASMGEYAKEAQNYAEVVGEAVGIDPSQWMRAQGVLMTLSTGFGVAAERSALMSENLTQLGYDLSSFFNISTEDAMTKIQSGISGELEPLRRLGFDLSQARLQAVALELGITKAFSAMTQAEKAQLRYYAIMTQVTTAQGDMARTLEAPANQLRIMAAQVKQLSRALGNIFIPALNAILPYAIAFVKAMRLMAQSIADFFGFVLPEIDYSSINSSAYAADGAADSLDSATKSAKKYQNTLLGIDEINKLNDKSDSSGGGAGTGSSIGDFDFELPTYDFLAGLDKQAEDLVPQMKSLLDLILKIGAGIAAWKIASSLIKTIGRVRDLFHTTDGLVGSILTSLKNTPGLLATIATKAVGITLVIDGVISSFGEGMKIGTSEANGFNILFNIAETVFGAALLTGSLAGGLLVGVPLSLMFTAFGVYQQRQNEIWEAWITSDTYRELQWIKEDSERRLEVSKEISVSLQDKIIGIDEINDQFSSAREMVNKLFTSIETGANPNVIKGYVDALNSYNIDGLQIEYDELTGSVNGTKEEMLALLDAMEKRLKMEAYADILRDAYKAEAELNVQLTRLRANYDDYNSKLKEYQSHLEYLKALQIEQNDLIYKNNGLSEEQRRRYDEIEAALMDTKTGYEATSGAINEMNLDLEKLSPGISEVEGLLADAQYQTSLVSDQMNKFSTDNMSSELGVAKNSWDNLSGSTTNARNVMDKYGKEAPGFLNNVINAAKTAAQEVSKIVLPDVSKIGVDFTKVKTTADYLRAIGVPGYASGGFPAEGQLFLAREAGAEMVGSIGRRTAVANNDQIVEGISSAVYNAIKSANGFGGEGDITIQIVNPNGAVESEQIITAAERRNRRDGRTVIPVGV